jgi:hypothetical protein
MNSYNHYQVQHIKNKAMSKEVKTKQAVEQPSKTLAELQKEIRLENKKRFLRGQRV